MQITWVGIACEAFCQCKQKYLKAVLSTLSWEERWSHRGRFWEEWEREENWFAAMSWKLFLQKDYCINEHLWWLLICSSVFTYVWQGLSWQSCHGLRLHSGSLDVHTIEELRLEKTTKTQSNCQPPITMHTKPCHLAQKVCLLNSIRDNKRLLVLHQHSRFTLILMLLYFGKIQPIPATSVTWLQQLYVALAISEHPLTFPALTIMLSFNLACFFI